MKGKVVPLEDYKSKDISDRDFLPIFKEAFQGRTDVVPEYWKSKNGDKAGYSPKCKNDWKPGLCQKRDKKPCYSCLNQDYTPLNDGLIRSHLAGKTILGVYPLLSDNTCRFLAYDLDNHDGTRDPHTDAVALYDVADTQDIPCYILRSKSGNGYHCYLFFGTPVPAWKARVIGFALLEEAGIIGEDVDRSSFDRMFPNQDRLSGKKLGNLIALPYQGKAARQGHTVLLDPETKFREPFARPREQLSRIRRVTESDLDRLIEYWNLQATPPAPKEHKQYDGLKQTKDINLIEAGCPWFAHTIADAATLPEPEWFAQVSISALCRDGEAETHRISEPFPKYNYDETQAKYKRELETNRPFSCEEIGKLTNGKYCKACKHKGRISNPIELGIVRTKAKSETTEEIFQDPIPFDANTAPSLPVDVFPDWVKRYIQEKAGEIQVPTCLITGNVIGVVSAAVARRIIINVKPGYNEPLNLFECLVLPSGQRKSAAQNEAIRPIFDWEKVKQDELKEIVMEEYSRYAIQEAHLKEIRKKASKVRNQEQREELIQEAIEIEKNLPEVPTFPRVIADDVTVEVMADLMASNDERIAIFSAEGGLFDTLAGRYQNNVPNLDLVLKSFSGDPVRVDRRNRPKPIMMRHPALTMVISPQPDVLQSMADKPGFRGRGFLARFLYILPKSMIGYRQAQSLSAANETIEKYNTNITRLLNYCHKNRDRVVNLSDPALDAWILFYNQVEKELRDGGKFEAMTDWAGKFPGQVARIAGLLHIMKYLEMFDSQPVSRETMEKAIRLGWILAEHALVAFGQCGLDESIECGKHILNYIKKLRWEEFTPRQAFERVKGKYKRTYMVYDGLTALYERGYIIPKDVETPNGPGRRPGIPYRVNPKVLENT